jgi:ribosomal protein L11 methyltransferase
MPVYSWCSLSCLPRPGVLIRAQIEDLLYSCGCEGLWDQPADECRAEAWSGAESSGFAADAGEALLTAYFPAAVQPQLAGLALKLKALDLSLTEPQIELVENEDWLENWRRNFTVTELTENTLVVPSWLQLPESETRLGLSIYPGLGFGTGTHETTRLAARFLEQTLLRTVVPIKVLDLGTGSGILAVLAAKRGAGEILALDIDADALANARDNCRHNLVSDRVTLAATPVAEVADTFHLIVANIIAPVLRQLAPGLPRLLRPGGQLILSGILIEQLSELTEVFAESGFRVVESRSSGEWTACLCEMV